ncbi:3-isopropylmalate dehydratase large subunit [Stutzerimonas nitrititolerans]|uniref:3-isopropylmalate dehydratase large subunit n=1 Tax=Stutzerimonas nitrititolerans TaxID=2482751 RepID=UPI0015E43069|nr:3-isopropylmalate dehydratase large subunit [Stutzerimonas nitrititolerans]MBA1236566.1 3-isopropylmalate dehydratase large subunit [Stutzerimonas stutzeri]MBT1121613.1 3-isopropylmalate dehydratase large subunit [Stutzerimonas nitrititolerans]
MTAQTLFEKLWARHAVLDTDDGQTLLYIDLHLINEVTSPQAFDGLRLNGLQPWRPGAVLATSDHNVPTKAREAGITDAIARRQVEALERNCAEFGLKFFDMQDERQGILHVIGPEQGITLPGMTIACGDSHTTTHGAFAALAFGIGTSEIEHILSTQCLLLKKLKTLRIRIDGELPPYVASKDLALALIGKIGTAGATGYAIEFTGDTIAAMSMEARMTLCNLAIEAGARCAMVAFDDTTAAYLKGRPLAPSGAQWDAAEAYWRTLHSDPEARFDRELQLDAASIRPHVTWGTSPEMVTDVDGRVPDPAAERDPVKRRGMQQALDYMGLEPGTPIREIKLDKIFIGSCTNSRLEDLRLAADVVKGYKVASNIVQALVVPGSGLVKLQAEAEGLDRIFTDAGFEWRDAGCSMCLGMNEDRLGKGERCASTSNRNFEGRQGPGGRSHLVSPAMAAAAAIAGHFTDIRDL